MWVYSKDGRIKTTKTDTKEEKPDSCFRLDRLDSHWVFYVSAKKRMALKTLFLLLIVVVSVSQSQPVALHGSANRHRMGVLVSWASGTKDKHLLLVTAASQKRKSDMAEGGVGTGNDITPPAPQNTLLWAIAFKSHVEQRESEKPWRWYARLIKKNIIQMKGGKCRGSLLLEINIQVIKQSALLSASGLGRYFNNLN